LPPIAIAVKSIPFNKIIRNLDARRRCRCPVVAVTAVACRQHPPIPSHAGIESVAV